MTTPVLSSSLGDPRWLASTADPTRASRGGNDGPLLIHDDPPARRRWEDHRWRNLRAWRQRWLTGAPCRNLRAAQSPPLGPLDWQPGDHATDAYACRPNRIRRQAAAAGSLLGPIAIQTI